MNDRDGKARGFQDRAKRGIACDTALIVSGTPRNRGRFRFASECENRRFERTASHDEMRPAKPQITLERRDRTRVEGGATGASRETGAVERIENQGGDDLAMAPGLGEAGVIR